MYRKEAKSSTFNRSVKSAVLDAKLSKKCCKRAHLLGILLFGQAFSENEVRFASENERIIAHTAALLKSLIGIDAEKYLESFSTLEKIVIKDAAVCHKIFEFFGYTSLPSAYTIRNEIFECEKCKAEFLKGVFLSCGNVSSPEKSYHLEMTVSYFNLSRELLYFLKEMSFEGKYTKRSSHYVIYYKESEKIADFLGFIGATQENFELNNTIIEKDIRNNINRLNNCETANLSKQISAAARQIDAINRLFSSGGADLLSSDLLETAQLRIEHPDASLSELAQLHNPHVTKSCVNRRLKKLTEETV